MCECVCNCVCVCVCLFILFYFCLQCCFPNFRQSCRRPDRYYEINTTSLSLSLSHTHTHTHKYISKHTHTHTHTYFETHTHIDRNTHTHTHTHHIQVTILHDILIERVTTLLSEANIRLPCTSPTTLLLPWPTLQGADSALPPASVSDRGQDRPSVALGG